MDIKETKEVKVVTVKRSELGTNCWSPLRFVNSCFQCSKYPHCKYPERVANVEFDRLASSVYRTFRRYMTAQRKLRELVEGGCDA